MAVSLITPGELAKARSRDRLGTPLPAGIAFNTLSTRPPRSSWLRPEGSRLPAETLHPSTSSVPTSAPMLTSVRETWVDPVMASSYTQFMK
jgi:hypothetical protein